MWKAATNGNQILGLIRRNVVYKEKELIIPLYKTIVMPHLEYCLLHRKKDVDTLERVQRRATKMVQKLRNISFEMRLKMWINNTRNQQTRRRSDGSV